MGRPKEKKKEKEEKEESKKQKKKKKGALTVESVNCQERQLSGTSAVGIHSEVIGRLFPG